MSWSSGGGRSGPSCAPPCLVSEAPVLNESANCSGGMVMKGVLQTGAVGELTIYITHTYDNLASAADGGGLCLYTASMSQMNCNFLHQDTREMIPFCLLEISLLNKWKPIHTGAKAHSNILLASRFTWKCPNKPVRAK